LRRIALLFTVVMLVAAMVLISALSSAAQEKVVLPKKLFPLRTPPTALLPGTLPLPRILLPLRIYLFLLTLRRILLPRILLLLRGPLLLRRPPLLIRERGVSFALPSGSKSGTSTGRRWEADGITDGGTSIGTSGATPIETAGTRRTTAGSGDLP
jgi:uncharacterized membrane protein YgcG